jgi:hypothetical protein
MHIWHIPTINLLIIVCIYTPRIHTYFFTTLSFTMARRYDSSTTTFSPEGRLHQVEYAIEAINNAGTCIGILAKDGIVMASERRITSGLLAPAKVRTLVQNSRSRYEGCTLSQVSLVDFRKDLQAVFACRMQRCWTDG